MEKSVIVDGPVHTACSQPQFEIVDQTPGEATRVTLRPSGEVRPIPARSPAPGCRGIGVAASRATDRCISPAPGLWVG